MRFKDLSAAFQARRLAVKRRLALGLGREFDPYPPPPPDLSLSPSRAHFADYETAPLRLSWRKQCPEAAAGRPDSAGLDAWQARARAKLAELTGAARQAGTPGEAPWGEAPRGTAARDLALGPGLIRRRVYVRARPDADIPVDLVWAEDMPAPRPVMVCLHGHNSGAHLSWGAARMPADPLKIAAGADYALQAAARGFVAVCVEQACFGERREREIARPSDHPCFDAAHHALLLGRTLLGERVTDVCTVIDWLHGGGAGLALDLGRIYAMGNSGGGEVALHAAALDTRIAGVIASGCVGFIRDTIGRRAACPDAVVPGILEWMERDDIVALVAPRVVLAISGVDDHIYPFAGVRAVIEAAAPVFRALGAEGALAALSGPQGHRFYPEIAWPKFLSMTGIMTGNEGS